jgi:hypothetical protein
VCACCCQGVSRSCPYAHACLSHHVCASSQRRRRADSSKPQPETPKHYTLSPQAKEEICRFKSTLKTWPRAVSRYGYASGFHRRVLRHKHRHTHLAPPISSPVYFLLSPPLHRRPSARRPPGALKQGARACKQVARVTIACTHMQAGDNRQRRVPGGGPGSD